MKEYSTHVALMQTSNTTWDPCPPIQHSRLGGCKPLNWMSLEKHSGILLQNKHKALGTKLKQSTCSGHWKSVRLPALELPDASCQLKADGKRNDFLSSMRPLSHLKKKYTYLHFSSPVHLEVKPPPRDARRGLPRRHLPLGSSADPTAQDLAVNGLTVPLARSDQYRRRKTEIHVYIPSGRKVVDAESLDEGFLEETDKLSMLSLEGSIH